MPQYMLLIYVPTDVELTPEQREVQHGRWVSYTQALKEAGAHVAGDALQGVDTATTVRVRDGETIIADGPFAETKEMLGGHYTIEVPDLDAALGWAARIPSAPYGSVEVRPVMQVDLEPASASQGGAQA